MSEQLVGVIIGGVIGIVGSIIGALFNHWLTLRRDMQLRKLEARYRLRAMLTDSPSDMIAERAAAVVATDRRPVRGFKRPEISIDAERLSATADEAKALVEELTRLQGDGPSLPTKTIRSARRIADNLTKLSEEDPLQSWRNRSNTQRQ